MYLVDDIHFEFTSLRRVAYLFDQIPDVIDRIVGGGIEFINGKRPTLTDGYAVFALSTGFRILGGLQAIDGLSQNACACCLPYAPGSAKKHGLSQLVGPDCIFEGLRNV
jgi:hypothetical protein